MKNSLEEHLAFFKNYAELKIAICNCDPQPLRLKLEHTFKVFENADNIVRGENLPPLLAQASRLAALYHDLGRFDQYLQFQTFKDALSFNHGMASLRLLLHNNILSGEDKKLARLVYTAVVCHNKRDVPKALQGDARIITNIVRNADKLDILRVMAKCLRKKPYNPTVILSLPDSPELHNGKVIKYALAGKNPSYDDLKSVNDLRVLLGAWFYDLNYASARELYKKMGYGLEVTSALPDDEIYGEVKAKFQEEFSKSFS